ncbi:MAG: NAD(P)-binding protein [Campylobacterales bacterium]|nr:NAD(P)-binding protein [Campylobacterales bacterium]
MIDYAIIGAGIGGCSAAALLKAAGEEVVLIEKEPYVGGCASTFTHKKHRYNTGATTICGYRDGGAVKSLFDRAGVIPELIPVDPAMVVIHKNKTIRRFRDVELFLEEIDRAYSHPKHRMFWELVRSVSETFYETKGYYYSNRSLWDKILSLKSHAPLLRKFWPYLHANAQSFIENIYGELSAEYLDFLNAQVLIVTQTTLKECNFLTAALALGYTFDANHYAMGGMGRVCESLISNLPDVRLGHEVHSIHKIKDGFHINTSRGSLQARSLIMGTSHFESSRWFDEEAIKGYYRRYQKLNNHQSAFVLYMTVASKTPFSHHYQLISDNIIPNTLSKALFVSFSDPADTHIASEGHYSVTASIHTDARWWKDISPGEYRRKKHELHTLLEQWICDTLSLPRDSIVESFAATPKTFGRYLNRTQLGGIAMSRTNILPFLPSNDTPIERFYQVGDTSYAAQGWPGVAMGAMNLMRLLNE